MQANNSLGIWKWLMILLLVCNIALIATIWFKPAQTNRPPHQPPVNFKEQFNLTKEQDDHFQQIRMDQRKTIDSLKKLTNEVRTAYFANLKTNALSATQLDSMAGILGTYHKLIEEQTYAHFKSVRDMLTPNQKATFDHVIGDVLKSLPEQPHYKGDGLGPKGRPDDAHKGNDNDDGPPPPDGDNPPPPDRRHHPGDGFGPPPPDGHGPPPDGPPQTE